MAAKNETFSWLFIVALAIAALWVVSKLNIGSSIFTGISSQRGLAGADQFGNPISPGSSGLLSS